MSRNVYIPVLLALLVIVTYLPVRNHDFVNYDDPDYVTNNAYVQQGITQQSVGWAFKNLHGERTYWHPLTWMSHMLDVEMFGLKPGGHHLVNVFWHALNVLLLFWLMLRLTGKPWRSAMVAALFAVHPLQVDSVAWITERKNLLSTFFLFLTTLAYLRYAARPSMGRNAVIFVFFALGLMAKPAIVTLPCLLLVLDYWPLRRVRQAIVSGGDAAAIPPYAPASWKQLVIEKLPLFALSAASSLLTVAGHSGLGMTQEGAQLSVIYRIENAIVSYVRYIGKAIWPSDLSVLYPHPGAWPRWQVIAAGALLLVITDQVLRHKRTRPYLMTGWLWFLGMLVPTIGILQVGVQAMADRFMYVPIIGLFIMGVWLVADVLERIPRRTAAMACTGAAAIAACIAISSLQLRHWKNSITLMEHALAVSKIPHYIPHHDLGVALTEQGKLEPALQHLQQALQINTNAITLFAIGRVRELEGKTNDAINIYLEAAGLPRARAQAYTLPQKRAIVLLIESGQTNAAAPLCMDLLQRTPRDPEVQYEAGMIMESQNIERAMFHYFEAMKLNPTFAPAMVNLAWILSTHPKQELRAGPEALDVAKRACILTKWKHAKPIATLAAANAETGNYQEALRLAQQSLEMTKASGSDTTRLEKMIKEFQAGKPYREG
jgi:tetratricopeptide (TPR) repeat protein